MARRVTLADEAAARRVRAILAAIARLEVFPLIGRRGDTPGTRELVCERHRIVYQVADDDGTPENAGAIMVLDIFGPGQP